MLGVGWIGPPYAPYASYFGSWELTLAGEGEGCVGKNGDRAREGCKRARGIYGAGSWGQERERAERLEDCSEARQLEGENAETGTEGRRDREPERSYLVKYERDGRRWREGLQLWQHSDARQRGR